MLPKNCTTCLDELDPATRAAMACAYEEPAEGARAWQHEGDDGDKFSVCPVHTAALPDVIDVARAYVHWKEGSLRERMGGLEPPPALLDGLELLSTSVADWTSWRTRPKEKS